MSGSLYNANDAALYNDYFNFPAGTLQALAGSETSYGTNLGSVGNVYQITSGTASNPGYGITGMGTGPNGSLNGNSAYDAGLYLSALQNGPANGNLATALQMYQGAGIGSNPKTPNSIMQQFLDGLSSFGSGATAATGGGEAIGSLTAAEAANAPVASAGSALSWLDNKLGISSALLRVFIAILALVLITVGLFSLSSVSKTVLKVVK